MNPYVNFIVPPYHKRKGSIITVKDDSEEQILL